MKRGEFFYLIVTIFMEMFINKSDIGSVWHKIFLMLME